MDTQTTEETPQKVRRFRIKVPSITRDQAISIAIVSTATLGLTGFGYAMGCRRNSLALRALNREADAYWWTIKRLTGSQRFSTTVTEATAKRVNKEVETTLSLLKELDSQRTIEAPRSA